MTPPQGDSGESVSNPEKNYTTQVSEEILACRKSCAEQGKECRYSGIDAVGAVMYLEGRSSRDEEVKALGRKVAAYRQTAINQATVDCSCHSTGDSKSCLAMCTQEVDAEAQRIIEAGK
jgi:translation elongation factor EF-Ts